MSGQICCGEIENRLFANEFLQPVVGPPFRAAVFVSRHKSREQSALETCLLVAEPATGRLRAVRHLAELGRSEMQGFVCLQEQNQFASAQASARAVHDQLV